MLNKFIIIFAVIFSSWLMFHTFSYNNSSIEISPFLWSDFSSTISLTRSFSRGENIPPEFPFFSGAPIRYHFLFYLLVGNLEKLGLRLDFALNSLSILGFSSLLIVIYFFAGKLFKSKAVGVLSVIFFLFNGSLGFIKFIKNNPLDKNFIQAVINNNAFTAFGPYNNDLISAFWNLNIYTNQRHLSLAYALSLIIIGSVLFPYFNNKKLKIRYLILIGLSLGFSFYLHFSVCLMSVIVLISISLFFPKLFKQIFIILIISGIVIFPQFIFLQQGLSGYKPTLLIGYLANPYFYNNLNVFNFTEYWFFNLGLHLILIPIGFILASIKLKKVFLVFLIIFIIGNLLQFSPEIASNHKFFNFFLIIGNMYSAFALVYFWKKHLLFKSLIIIIIFFLTLTGIIDFFPIKNSERGRILDAPQNPDIQWILDNTKPSDNFLNTQFLFDPATLAGRKIFLGWPYFAWSQGLDSNTRMEDLASLLKITDKEELCTQMKQYNLTYLSISKFRLADRDLPKVSDFILNLKPVYSNKDSGYSIINPCR